MLTVASDALATLKASLGIQGKDAPTTVVEDGVLRQVIDISRNADRSQAYGLGEGLFPSVITQSHTAGGTLLEDLNPYSPGTVTAPLNLLTPKDSDWWYLGAGVTIGSTSQTSIDEVQFIYDPLAVEGFTDGTVAAEQMLLARWDEVLTNAGAGIAMINSATGMAFQPAAFPFRWSRNNQIRVASKTTGAGTSHILISALWCLTKVGLYPNAV